MDERVYNIWVIACPSKSIEGQWVAHALEFDVVSQGNSLEHAILWSSAAMGSGSTTLTLWPRPGTGSS